VTLELSPRRVYKNWDTHRLVGNHSAVVKLLDERGLVSTYHDYFHEPQGEESRHTMFFYRRRDRTFHLDYIFIPRGWATRLRTVEVGQFLTWSKLSDHCPVVVEVVDE
jgi:exodeoxyribonuclease III